MPNNSAQSLAIIPAREGSKRIIGKNYRNFHGRPMISYSIAAALKTNVFDRVIVSTDSEKIAEIARQNGAEVPFLRPIELADDQTALAPVILHAIDWLKQNQKQVYSYVCCIFAAAPLLRVEDLQKGYELIREPDCDSVISVVASPYPIARTLRQSTSGMLEMIWPEHMKTRSQDLPKTFHDAAQFYWSTPDSLFKNSRFLSPRSKPVVIPSTYAIDINTEEDWNLAELLFAANI